MLVAEYLLLNVGTLKFGGGDILLSGDIVRAGDGVARGGVPFEFGRDDGVGVD